MLNNRIIIKLLQTYHMSSLVVATTKAVHAENEKDFNVNFN